MYLRPRPRPGHPYLAGAPLLIAHRGGARLAPENTMAAFRSAVERWHADILELDVHATADRRVVVIHDQRVDRTTDGEGAVAQMPWSRLRELDAGHRFRDLDGRHAFRGRGVRIPLLEELLDTFPRTRLNVELKAGAAAEPTGELIRRHGAEDRVLIAAEHEGNRRAVQGYPGPWGASRKQLTAWILLHRTPAGRLLTPACDAFQVPIRHGWIPVVTEAFVREAHARNIPVHVWTVDQPDTMRELLRLGVDGIQSDRPDLLARVLHEEAGRPLPPGLSEAGA